MMNKLSFKVRMWTTGLFTLFTSALLFLEYTADGRVDVHYLLHDKDLPGISNWWGLLIIPLLSWTCLARVSKRQDERLDVVVKRFVLALLFSATTSVAFSFGYDPASLMLLPFIAAFFYPLYKSEFLLGFVTGSLLFVGAAIPTLFGVVLLGIYFFFYRLGRIIYGFWNAKKPGLQ